MISVYIVQAFLSDCVGHGTEWYCIVYCSTMEMISNWHVQNLFFIYVLYDIMVVILCFSMSLRTESPPFRAFDAQ